MPVAVSHILIIFRLADAIRLPSGLQATEKTPLSCPRKTVCCSPVSVFQTLTLKVFAAKTTCFPSGLKARSLTLPYFPGGAVRLPLEYSVNKRLDELYSDQRDERVNLWRDVSRLRIQLPENAQQYLSAYRKVAILEDTKGDVQ